jgi:integrase
VPSRKQHDLGPADDLGRPEHVKALSYEQAKEEAKAWFEKLADTPARVRSPKGGEQKFKKATDDFEAKRRRRNTANRILTVLKAALNKAVDLECVHCSVNAWKLVKPFRKTDSARLRFLSIEDQKKLVDACTADFQPLVKGAQFTGARYGELTRLMHVRDFNEGTGQVFVTSDHELRHTYASTLIMATVPLTVIAQQLGHRDTRMVDKHYGHLAKKYVTDTIRNLSPKLNLTDVNLPAPSPPVAS